MNILYSVIVWRYSLVMPQLKRIRIMFHEASTVKVLKNFRQNGRLYRD